MQQTLIVVMVLFQILDGVTTRLCLRAGGGESAGPMLWIMARFGRFWPFAKFGIAGACLVVVWIAHVKAPSLTLAASWAVVAAYTAVIANNLLMLRKLTR